MAEDSVIEFAPVLPAEFRDARLLPNLLALATEDAEEQRMTAAKLLGARMRARMHSLMHSRTEPLPPRLALRHFRSFRAVFMRTKVRADMRACGGRWRRQNPIAFKRAR